MSFPNIPNVTPSISINREDVVNLLLASIAFEELGLAHIINAEAEKIQAVLGTLPGSNLAATNIAELLATNESVNNMLKTVIKKEMLLQFKLEDILKISTTTSTTSSTTTSTSTTSTSTSTTSTSTSTTSTSTSTTSTSTSTTSTSTSTTSTSTSTSTTTETTTSTTETTTSTTPAITTVENVASVEGLFNNITYTDVDHTFYTTTNTNTPGFNTTNTLLNSGTTDIIIGGTNSTPGINLGQLPNFLLFFADGRDDANWQGASKGFVGNVAVDGIQAAERTSGFVPYAGTIFTNDVTLDAWQQIVNDNPGQAFGSTGQVALISSLESDLVSAIQQINALPATPGFTSVDSSALNGLNTQNGVNELFVINVTSGFNVSDTIHITGDPGDVFVLRWDEGVFNPADGYQGIVKFQSGGGIEPLGGLTPTNFINVAGDINSSGGGTTPPPPYPQGPRFNNGQGSLINGGQDFSGGGFFTGYWLTTGAPDIVGPGGLLIGPTQPLSNGIFVGGWYSLTTKFSMTSGTSGVYVSPNPSTRNPSIDILKEVSVNNGASFEPAGSPPFPVLPPGFNPQYRITITNTGDAPLSNVVVTDPLVGGVIANIPILNAGAVYQIIAVGS